jgi:two-component system response regulator PilR (NtrC family)
MQAKLLRAIQEKAVRPVGASAEVRVDTRILSATHQDLAALVEQGRFRQDLFYRINVIELRVPSLRERHADIPLLAEHILEQLTSENGHGAAVLTDAALAALRGYPFPGNVRELENILERALALAEDQRIDRADLRLAEGTSSGPNGGGNGKTQLPRELGEIERERILEALEQTRWNRTAAAKRLGLSLRQLRYRLKKLELE